MKRTKITETSFGKIIEEVYTCKFDCTQTHIYIYKKPIEEVEDYLLNLVRTVPEDKIHSYIVHCGNNTKNLLEYFCES